VFESIKDPGFAEQARAPWLQALLWEKENPQALAPIEAYLQRYPNQQLQAAATALQAKQQQLATDKDRQQGFEALRGKHLETAAAEFNSVLQRSPNDANALVGLGFVRLNQKRFSEALSYFDHARKIDPKRQDALNGYNTANFWLIMQSGADAQQQGRSGAAIAAFQKALTLRPFDDGALLGLASALVKERRYSEAETKFRQVLTREPNNVDALAGMGFVRLNQGQFNEAQNFFARVQKLDPTRKDVSKGYHNAEFWGVMHKAAALNQQSPKAAVAEYQQAVLLNPNDKDALRGLADARMRAGDYSGAATTYNQLAAAYPADPSVWLELLRAQLAQSNPQAVLVTAQRIPAAVKLKLESGSEFFSEMALAYFGTNQLAACDQALRIAFKLAKSSDNPNALGMRLQLAGKLMNQGKSGRAIEIYIQATQSNPDDPNTFQALIGAYVRQSDFVDAATALRSMPQKPYEAALKNAGFLNSAALIYSNQGQCSRAEDFLNRSFALARATGQQPDESAQLQQADIWMRQHSYTQAQNLYREIIASHANSAAAWRGYLVALHQSRADRRLATEIPHIPGSVRAQLETDPSFLILEASAYSTIESNQQALPLLEKAREQYASQHKQSPLNLDIQTAWTMLAVAPNEPGLGNLLLSAKSRPGLTMKQRGAIEELWTAWSVGRAKLALKSKPQVAYSILVDAARVYPRSRDIRVALASLYLKRNDKQGALDVFQSWGMVNAQAADYRMAAGAALSAHKNELADQFLQRGLARFPNDAGLLHMSARREIARGNYNEGEQELRSALVALREQDTAEPDTRALVAINTENAAALSNADVDSDAAASSSNSAQPCRAEQPHAAGKGHIRPISLTFVVPQDQTQSSQPPSPQAQAQKQLEKQQMEDEVEAVKNRNTPVMTLGGVGVGRVGDAGIDRLVILDSSFGAAYTIYNTVRLSVQGDGVFAYSGTPDGSSKLQFGTLPAYALFGEQS